MNKFLTFPGTQPIYLGDIDFMQDAAAAAFALLSRAILNKGPENVNAILQGVEFSSLGGNQYQYTAGVVVVDGEVLPVPAGSVTVESSSVKLYLHIASDMSGERTFKDESTHECYETRRAYIDGVSTGGIDLDDLPRLFHRPADVVKSSRSHTGSTISSGKIYRRNGIWFFEIDFSLTSGANTVGGNLTFDGSDPSVGDFYDSIDEGAFPCLIWVYNQASYAGVLCQVIKQPLDRSIVLTVGSAESITVAIDTTAHMTGMMIPASTEIQ